ncbi:hypothetical protein WJX77_001803 [Trebouxia sp. C0004]
MQSALTSFQVHAHVTRCQQRPCGGNLRRQVPFRSHQTPATESVLHRHRGGKQQWRQQTLHRQAIRKIRTCRSSESGDSPPKNTEFGYSRKDVIIIGVSIFGGGFAMYYGLQAGGLSAGIAGNFVQLFVVLGLCIGWIGSYIFRVANKDMTYVKQLENYEEEVMAKRLEEMPESEREKLMASVEAEKERRQARQQQSK